MAAFNGRPQRRTSIGARPTIEDHVENDVEVEQGGFTDTCLMRIVDIG